MFKMLIDTCVWLDLAKDPKQTPTFDLAEELVRRGKLSLMVPRIVLDEFRRNRERVAKESAKSLSTHFRVVKEAVTKAGGLQRRMRAVLSHLDDVDRKIPDQCPTWRPARVMARSGASGKPLRAPKGPP